MIHLQNFPHLHNDRDAIRFHCHAAHTDPLPCLLGIFARRNSPPRPATAVRDALTVRTLYAPATNREAIRHWLRRKADLNQHGARGGRSWQVGERRILPAGRDPCRRSKSVQIHGGGSRPIPAPAFRSSRFHLQVRRRSEWLCADRQMRAPARGTSRPTFRSAAARRTGLARTSNEVCQTAKSE